MRPYIFIFALLVFVGLSLIYIKEFGFSEYYRFLMNNGLGYTLAFFAGAFAADIIREAKEG